jgi:hypothetical protein
MGERWPAWYLEGMQEFFRDVHPTLSSGDFLYDEVFESALFPLQRRDELRAMLEIADRISPKTVYEIGADKGGSLYHWCRQKSVRRVIAAEIGGIPYRQEFETAFPHIRFCWLPQSSYAPDSISRVREFLGEQKIDCLFIDGDKNGFEKDFRAYRDLLSDRSITFMHDLYDEGPRQAFEVVSKEFPHVRLVNTLDSVQAVLDELDGLPIKRRQDQWLRHWRGSSAGVGVLFTGRTYGA